MSASGSTPDQAQRLGSRLRRARFAHWLLAQRLSAIPKLSPLAEQILVPVHPVPAKVDPNVYNAYAGEYEDQNEVVATVFRQGDRLFSRDRIGEVTELLPENAMTFFYPTGERVD